MIESIENLIQIFTTGLCSVICSRHFLRTRKHVWMLMGLASGVYFLGDLYWQFFLFFYGESPYYSHISYVSWYGCYIFLLMIIKEFHDNKATKYKGRLFLLVPVFTVGMCIFYIQWGDYLSNIAAAVLMTMLIGRSLVSLTELKNDEKQRGQRWFFFLVLMFCTAEYNSWTLSCFWMGDTLKNPYFWSDTFLSVLFLIFPFVLAAVERDNDGRMPGGEVSA